MKSSTGISFTAMVKSFMILVPRAYYCSVQLHVKFVIDDTWVCHLKN